MEQNITYVISGCFVGGGTSNTFKKTALREVMTLSKGKQPQMKTEKKCPPLYFFDEDLGDILPDHNDPLVITAYMANFEVRRVFVDQGSSVDIMFYDLFKTLGLMRSDLIPMI